MRRDINARELFVVNAFVITVKLNCQVKHHRADNNAANSPDPRAQGQLDDAFNQ